MLVVQPPRESGRVEQLEHVGGRQIHPAERRLDRAVAEGLNGQTISCIGEADWISEDLRATGPAVGVPPRPPSVEDGETGVRFGGRLAVVMAIFDGEVGRQVLVR